MKEKTRYRMLLVSLLAVPFIWALSNSMIIPILPLAQQQLALTKFQSGLIISALSIPTAILLPFTGFLSDRYGRVTVMVPAILLYGLSGLAAGIAAKNNSYPLILLSRSFQGVGATGTSLLALSYAGDLYQNQNQAKYLSYLESANSFGKLVSPLISTLTSQIRWYAPFFVFPITAIPVGLALLLFKIKPKNLEQTPPKLTLYFADLTQLLIEKKRLFLVASIATFTTVFLWFGNLFFLAEVVNSYKFTPWVQGGLLALPVLAMTITTTITGKYLIKFPLRRLIHSSLLIIGLAMLLALCMPKEFILYAMVTLIGIGFGIGLPALNSLVVGSVASSKRGVVTTFYGSLRALGSALGPIAFASAMNYGKSITLIGASSLAIIVAFLVILTGNRHNTR